MMKTTLLTVLYLSLIAPLHFAGMLEVIKKRGNLKCGVSTGITGFSEIDNQGQWKGLEVSICRALAVGLFGDKNKVEFIPLSAKDRIIAVQTGSVDVLLRNTTFNFDRNMNGGVEVPAVVFYDGQAILLPKKLKITKIEQLKNAKICVEQASSNEGNLANYFKQKNIPYKSLSLTDIDQLIKNYESGACDALTSDKTLLMALQSQMKNPQDHVFLNDIFSKEPLGIYVASGDFEFFNVVKWVVNLLITAEEIGVNSQNIDEVIKTRQEPLIQKLFNANDTVNNTGIKKGLINQWPYQIIKQVGNYEEIFEANLGKKSILNNERGLNALWNKGGLMYAPPF